MTACEWMWGVLDPTTGRLSIRGPQRTRPREHARAVVVDRWPHREETTVLGRRLMLEAPTPGGGGTREGRVLLLDQGADRRRDRYVTAWQGRDGDRWDTSWFWGHYFDDEEQARLDYTRRAERGY